jgi:hypothetical protein
MSEPTMNEMCHRGRVVQHADSSGADIGISVGLGDCMLYAGEVPGRGFPVWALKIYYSDGVRSYTVGASQEPEGARECVEAIARSLCTPTTPGTGDGE